MTIDLKSLAREGAKARLWQLETEKNQLLVAFPDLRGGTSSRVTSQEGSRRGRREMTAAERRSVSVRMKRYWEERRQKNGAARVAPVAPRDLPSAKASPLRAERRLRLLRRNAGRRFGNRARPRQRPRAGAPSATVKQARHQFTTPPFGGRFGFVRRLFIPAGEVPRHVFSRHLQGLRTDEVTATRLLVKSSGGVMDEPSQGIDGEKLDLPLNQEPGTAAPEFEINYEIEREEEDRELGKDEGERQELDRSEAGM